MKQVKNILFLVSMIAYLIVVSGFISSKTKIQRISALDIQIVDSAENQFINTKNIQNILTVNQIRPVGNLCSEIELEKIENTLKSRQIIDRAEAYFTGSGKLCIEISQKTPFVRVFNRSGQGYYLDRKGNIIPLTGHFSPFIIVANGYISEPFTLSNTMNILNVKHDSIKQSLHTIYDVYHLADYITKDDFWNAQIEQIYVNNRYEIELIPRVGAHIIELGKVENLDEKFQNLKTLYLRGFNNLGWNQYEKISLKYKNQVVCTKIQ